VRPGFGGTGRPFATASGFLAVSFRSRKRFLKLYFGTPYEKYREKLLLDWGRPFEIRALLPGCRREPGAGKSA